MILIINTKFLDYNFQWGPFLIHHTKMNLIIYWTPFGIYLLFCGFHAFIINFNFDL